MFVDRVEVTAWAGDGGNGAVSFRHEKFIDRGGPDGGDGGDGGDVILVATQNQHTLAAFRYKKELKAGDGRAGSKQRKHGRSGLDKEILVPNGTVALTEAGDVLADLVHEGQRAVIAHGGRGGFGNAHFVSSVRQAPRIAEKGEAGERLQVILELKMIADVGLVGLPNAGKSTLLSVVSNARPEIAGYPFTTLKPNLGVVDVDGSDSLLMADIPGLIAGASQGKGLGDEFLRHVERTAVLLHLIDCREDVAAAYAIIMQELKDYTIDLSKRPQIVVLSKIDGLDDELLAAQIAALRQVVPKRTQIMAFSSHSKDGLPELLRTIQKLVEKGRAKVASQAKKDSAELPVLRMPADQMWQVQPAGDGFVVTGRRIERFAARTDFSSDQGVQRLRDIMRKMGIWRALEKQGIKPGQKITIGQNAFGSLEY